eukprot:2928017-Alexandrium_andersonii.AAC.1
MPSRDVEEGCCKWPGARAQNHRRRTLQRHAAPAQNISAFSPARMPSARPRQSAVHNFENAQL